jgi:hypoxanthine phosphoribosyltransferase
VILPSGYHVVLEPAALQERVEDLARRVEAAHPEGVVLVGVLKGAFMFLADLARAMTEIDVAIDFLAISRYAPDSGRVKILKDLDIDVTGRTVVIVEDLVDTGLTLQYLARVVQARGPKSLEVCALLDRPSRRIVPLEIRYVGLEVERDQFLLGYGLHVEERYRNLPMVLAADGARGRG